ncbi:zinc ribbon domain-containing protein [Nostoc sp. NMS1]|uniref:zinc ribbon domain-containing protein n=1 Tax=Nostoc sp. NMS1 TaxID=2815388 RepID=UPI0025D1CB50|nr:zinc ribbon domain-containing protein [Nostoc sp. NMS1]
MLRNTIKYKVELIGGVFIEVPTKKVKPFQTCPKCGYQHKKTQDIRVHNCTVCGYQQDRDIAAAEVMLYWAKEILPESGTGFVDAESPSSTSSTKARKQTGSMKQLGAMKRQKSVEVSANNELRYVETRSSGGANCG